jgi:hypothetical protein
MYISKKGIIFGSGDMLFNSSELTTEGAGG